MQVETIHNTPATPWVFPLQSKIGEHIIRYDGLTEFAQGSPLIGSLFVDDKKMVHPTFRVIRQSCSA